MGSFELVALTGTMAPSRKSAALAGLLPDRRGKESSTVRASEAEGQRTRAMAAKLSLPHMGFILSRARLHALVEPVRGGGVISLVAGPGYGKTAFIVDLLSSAEGSSVYLALDEGDRDPLRFISYLMAGVGMEPDTEAEVRSWDWTGSEALSATVTDLMAKVAEFTRSRGAHKTLIAIDDFHLVESSPQTILALELLIKGLPPGWRILVSSRRALPLRLDSVGLGGRLVQLTGRQLRLTPTEVAAWASNNWGVQLQLSEARALWRVTEGWPAVLALLGQRLLSMSGRITRADLANAIARGRELRAYLEDDIFAGLDPAAARIMLTAGLLPGVVFPRDDALFEGHRDAAEALLADLVSNGFLVTRAGRRIYTVHPLVRGFAERQARQTQEGVLLMAKVAAHLELAGQNHHAAYLYMRSGRYADASRPLRSLALSSLNPAVNFTREEWLELMPDHVSAEECGPWLLVAKARALQGQSEYAEAAQLYEEAARLLAARGEREGLLPVLLGSAFCLFIQGLWEECLAVFKRCRTVARTPDEKAEVLVGEGVVLVSICRWDEAVEDWERALILASPTQRPVLAQRVYLGRCRLFFAMGHHGPARSWAEKAIASGTDGVTPALAMGLNAAGVLAYLAGDYDEAERYADSCRRLAQTRGFSYVDVSSVLSQAAVAMGRSDYRTALTRLKEARSLAARAGDAEQAFWAEEMLGDLFRCNRNAQRALEHHRAALDMVDKNHLAVFERVRALTAIGMDLVALGREAEAQVSLEETARLSRHWGLKSSLSPSLFYLGWLHARSGREREAASCLQEAMRIAEEHSYVHLFGQEARVAAPVLALCDRFGVGAFARSRIVPLLSSRLQSHFHELAEGKTYPTDVTLGYPQRRERMARESVRHTGHSATGPGEDIEALVASLTEREQEVLRAIAGGMPNKTIGARLYISEKTVKTHANHIFRKLGVTSRVQAILIYQSHLRVAGAGSSSRRRPR